MGSELKTPSNVSPRMSFFTFSSSGVIFQSSHNWVPIMWAIRRRHYEVNKKWIELQQRGCVQGEIIRQLLPAADGGWSREPGAACVKLCRWHSADGATPLQPCWSSSALWTAPLTCWCLCFSTQMWNICRGPHEQLEVEFFACFLLIYFFVCQVCFDVFNIQTLTGEKSNLLWALNAQTKSYLNVLKNNNYCICL